MWPFRKRWQPPPLSVEAQERILSAAIFDHVERGFVVVERGPGWVILAKAKGWTPHVGALGTAVSYATRNHVLHWRLEIDETGTIHKRVI